MCDCGSLGRGRVGDQFEFGVWPSAERRRLRLVIVATLLLSVLMQSAAATVARGAGQDAPRKVALVIGHSAYLHIGQLANPRNDAADMEEALQRLGFDVTPVLDGDLAELNEALRRFARQSAGADVALVFYAGHGMEMDGVNYLLPVDARLERDTDVVYETVPLDRVLRATEGGALRVVILDACRNNPLAAAMQRTRATRSISRGAFGDLDERLLGDEMLVAYAAAEGTDAEDGTGRNSPFTTALLAHLEEPLEIGALFRRVRAAVLAATDGRQRPHEYQALLREHYLSGTSGRVPIAAESSSGASVSGGSDAALGQQVAFWEAIRESSAPGDFREFLRLWPTSNLAGLAASRLEQLRAEAPDHTATATGGDSDDVGRTMAEESRQQPRYTNNADRLGGADGRVAPVTLDAAVLADLPTPPVQRVFFDCEVCPQLVIVPPGPFNMGAPGGEAGRDEDEGPVHQVTISEPFAVGMYEVSFRDWDACTTGGGCGGRRPSDEGWGREDRPVIDVSWNEAQAYVKWLSERTGHSYRLLSEAEWEYAARAGVVGARYWDKETQGCRYANSADRTAQFAGVRWSDEWTFASCEDGFGTTAPVGSFETNGFGLHDMLGNVWEWVEDCWNDRYSRPPDDGTAWKGGDCSRRVVRGGAWNSQPLHIRAAVRDGVRIGVRSNNLGFRVARAVDTLDETSSASDPSGESTGK